MEKGRHQITMAEVPIPKVQEYCGEDVDYTCRLHQVLSQAIKERALQRVYYEIELPLIPVLARMERHGIYVDSLRLGMMADEINALIYKAAEEVYALAGVRFNLNSPKQLSEVLYTKMGIKPPRKTATGHSTNADVLENLAEEYPVARKMLAYRSLEKLRSTYIEALPGEIDPRTSSHPTPILIRPWQRPVALRVRTLIYRIFPCVQLKGEKFALPFDLSGQGGAFLQPTIRKLNCDFWPI